MEKDSISLEAIYQRTKVSKTTVYRILKTFVHRGYLAQTQDGHYRLVSRPQENSIRASLAKMRGNAVF